MNNKILAIILGILVVIFAISQFTGSNKSRSFDPNVLSLDDTAIDHIEISLAGGTTSTVTKNGDDWKVSNGSTEYKADDNAVTSILNELKTITAKKVVARSEEKAASFEVNDENATKIIAKNGNKVMADINVGRFSFDQQTRKPISYIKKAKGKETFLVQSFLAMSLKKDFNSLRDKSFLAVDKASITKLHLLTPDTDLVYTLGSDGNWSKSDGIQVDSSGIQLYLNGLSDVKGVTFSDDISNSNNDPAYALDITLNDGGSFTTYATSISDDLYKVFSNQHAANVFESNESGLVKKLFLDLSQL